MNTFQSISETQEDTSGSEWLREKEDDLASWLDEVDIELHEQMVCGAVREEDEKKNAHE